MTARFAALAGTLAVLAVAGAAGGRLLWSDGGGSGRQVELTPVRDTYVTEAKPDQAYGDVGLLRADAGPVVVRAYLHFDVPAHAGVVERAYLRLYANSPDRTGIIVARVPAADWTESITWRTAPPVAEAVGQGREVHSGDWVDIDLRALVTGSGPVDLALLGTGDTMVSYSSREGGAATAPRLVIRYRD